MMTPELGDTWPQRIGQYALLRKEAYDGKNIF